MKRERDFWSIFMPFIWIFKEGECDEIKPRQPSKRDRTLTVDWATIAEINVFTKGHSE